MNENNILSEKLCKARKYVDSKKLSIKEYDRPYFHMSSPIGWLNDPNGFSLYKKEYHLFYQYHPYDTKWNAMYWGHCKTTDFIKWEYLPIALAPDENYDSYGCYSGSAIEYEGNQILMYTGVSFKEDKDGNKSEYQTQCVAYGDGINYKKLNSNPVIQNKLLPEGSQKNNFRDPKIWRDKDGFYAVIASKDKNGSGQIALFYSENTKEWSFKNILASSNYEYGVMWECPDFFFLDDTHVLILSPQEMLASGFEFHNGNSTLYLLGDYDKSKFKFEDNFAGTIDYGLDFYAPQTLETENGRRIMIAWMHSWENNIYPEDFEWVGMMTIPRELHIKNKKLYQLPIKEIENYYNNSKKYNNIVLNNETNLEGIYGRNVDLEIEVQEGHYEYFSVEIAKNDLYKTTITYSPKENTLVFNRYLSGIRKDCIYERKILVEDRCGKINLRILLDKYSVEIFVNNGAQAITSLIFTPIEAQGILFRCEGEVIFSVEKHDIITN